MLCTVKEKGMDKCAQYWPLRQGESLTFGDVTVLNTGVFPLSAQHHSVQRSVLRVTYGKAKKTFEVRTNLQKSVIKDITNK